MKPRSPRPVPEAPAALPTEEQLLDDQSRCWIRGELLVVETYLRDYPALSGDREIVLDLICHEMLLRTRRGEQPDPAEYLARFPDYAEDLEAQFAVRSALEAPDDSPSTVLGSVPGERANHSLPQQVAGYQILSELGRGGMGVVYLARHLALKRLVALKMIQSPALACPRHLERFRGEAEVLARLQHPNIIQIYEVGEWEDRPFLALEYVPGGGLDRRLRGSPQPPRSAAELILSLAQAIDVAHQAGIIHRDLKPANILLAADDTPRITDFGLAKRLDAQAQTTTGDILGTPHYMAPEQARGNRGSVGPGTDVYALGAILYELLTGRPPFNGSTVWDTLEQMVSLDPVLPSRLQARVPRDLEVICLKCLAKDPTRRYLRAADLAADLRSYLVGDPIRARPAPVWERVWKWARRRPGMAVLAGSMLLFALLLFAGVCTWFKATASQARLEAHEARDREAAALALADFHDELRQIEAACTAQRWRKAGARLDGLARQLDVAEQTWPTCTALAELRGQLEPLRQTITLQQTARDRLTRFRGLRTEAGFLVMGLAGTRDDARYFRAQTVVAEAFTLMGAQPECGVLKLPDSSILSPGELREVQEGCCEMLLGLAQMEEKQTNRPGAAESALRLVDRADRLGVSAAMCQARRAHILARLGRAEEATAARILAQNSPLTRAFEFFLTGTDRYAEGDLPGAVAAFEKALSLEPNHAAAAYALALPHLRLRVLAEDVAVARAHLVVARMSLTVCINHEPDLPWPYLCRAFALGELGEIAAAEADFHSVEQLLAARPDAAARYALLVSRGALLIRGDNLDQAIADLKEAISLEPRDYQAHVNLARAYQKRHDDPAALAHLNRALELAPLSAQAAVYRTRARLNQEAGRPTAAAADLAEAARGESGGPSSALVVEDQFARGRLLAQSHDYEGAVAGFTAALLGNAHHPGALRARAEALLRLHRFSDALADLDRLLEQNRERQIDAAPLYRARAMVRARAGDHQGALDDYTQLVDLAPDAAAHTGRAWEYLALNSPALALADCERALRMKPQDSDAHFGRAFARVKMGRYQEAVADVETALRLGTSDHRSTYLAARVYAQAANAAHEDKGAAMDNLVLAERYQTRAVALLREAVTALPASERAAFWDNTVRRDAVLSAVRTSRDYRQLAESLPTGPSER